MGAYNLLFFRAIFENLLYSLKLIVYGIFRVIAQVADWVELLFKAFCGLIRIPGTDDPLSYDPATVVLTNQTIQSIFTSMLIIGGVLLFVTTFVAIIRTEFAGFSDKEGNSKTKVFGNVGRAIVNMFVIPICCILGVIMANVILRAFYDAINRGSNGTLATQTFLSMSYSANRARNDEKFVQAYNSGYNEFGVLNETLYPGFEYADMIDAAFLNNISFVPLASGDQYIVTDSLDGSVSGSGKYIYYAEDKWAHNAKTYSKHINAENVSRSFTIYDAQTVALFYDISEMNMLLGIVAIIIVAYNYVMMIIGLIKRLFDIGLYYMISPPIIALYPIDKGEGTKLWRTRMLSAIFAAYGGVAAINIFLILLPIVLSIDFVSVLNFPSFIAGVISYFVRLLIVIAGTTFIKQVSVEIQKMLLGKEAGDGALGDGAGAMKDVAKTIGKAVSLTAAGIGAGAQLAGTAVKGVAGGARVLATKDPAKRKAALQRYKHGMLNAADRSLNKLTAFGGKAKAAFTGGKYDKSKTSKTQARDAINFFKTGTTNKELQQGILRVRNEMAADEANLMSIRKGAGMTDDMINRNAEIDRLTKALGDKANGPTTSLSRRDQQRRTELDRLRAEQQSDFAALGDPGELRYDPVTGKIDLASSDELAENAGVNPSEADQRRIQARKDYEYRSGRVAAFKDMDFFTLRAIDQATGGGKNVENVSGSKARSAAQYAHDAVTDYKYHTK